MTNWVDLINQNNNIDSPLQKIKKSIFKKKKL